MFKVGLTGGIGSGKSTIASIFKVLGVPVYNSDEQSKLLLGDEKIKLKLKEVFTDEIFNGEEVDKKKLGQLVFNDPQKLSVLNSIMHPAVKESFVKWLIKQKSKSYIIKEAAILIETGLYKELDKIILVTAPVEARVKRVIKRDKVLSDEVLARMNNQLKDEEKIKHADWLINNDESSFLIEQVLNIHYNLKRTG